jgi:hypothetical protein
MPDLQLHEITCSTGDTCGSIYLDRGFLDFVERKLGLALSLESRQNVSLEQPIELIPLPKFQQVLSYFKEHVSPQPG